MVCRVTVHVCGHLTKPFFCFKESWSLRPPTTRRFALSTSSFFGRWVKGFVYGRLVMGRRGLGREGVVR